MGIHNAMTENKYKILKSDINSALKSDKYDDLATLDKKVASKYGFSRSTGHNVRVTRDYQEYQEKVFRFHNHPRARMPRSTALIKDCVQEGQAGPHYEWLIVLLITLLSLVTVETVIIIIFWSK